MGGANAHAIIDAASSTTIQNGVSTPKLNGVNGVSRVKETNAVGSGTNEFNGINGNTKDEQRLLVFSAHSESSLQRMLSNYSSFVERGSFSLSDLAYTLSVRRHHWNARSFCVSNGSSIQAVSTVKTPTFKGLLFIFTGQGAQWAGMGRELLRDFATFGEDIRKMDNWLAESSFPPAWKIEGKSIALSLSSRNSYTDFLDTIKNSVDINTAEFAQPICTSLQIAMVNLLRLWGVLPTTVVGHSSGEIAAAYAAGALGMRDALLVSYYRGIATSGLLKPGAMGAVGLGRHELEGLLVGNVVLACENSGSSVTISGDLEDVEASLNRVSQMRPGVLARRLKVDKAYHSGE